MRLSRRLKKTNLSFYLLGIADFLVLIMQMSLCHIDYMDSDLTPPENSQYTIAAFIQECIDEYINKMKFQNLHGQFFHVGFV